VPTDVEMNKENLREKDVLILSLLDSIQDPFFVLGQRKEFLMASPKAIELIGSSSEEIQKLDFADLIVSDDKERALRGFEEAGSNQQVQWVTRIISSSGERIPVQIFVTYREEIYWVTVRDLRDRIRTEEHWERTKRELIEKIRERDQYARELQAVRDLYKGQLKEIKEMKEKIELLSYTDELTGICNRRFFIQLLTLEMERQKRYPEPLALLMIDIDYFKDYNDANGHLAGDHVLKEIAALIEHGVRHTDTVARFGGEEFTALLINAGREEGMEIAERVRRIVAESHFPNEQNQPNGNLTISIGIVTFSPSISTPLAFIREADNALYRAKRAGRNRLAD
jgi:diguanylate cyclase (GGDEF)-like protein/PAS domain S-box-containing protein